MPPISVPWHADTLTCACTGSPSPPGQVAVGRERAGGAGSGTGSVSIMAIALMTRSQAVRSVFGFEVAGLIEDKAALLANIGTHLAPGGAW